MKKVREIRSQKGALHFQRFQIFSCKLFSIYVHKIYKADKDEHMHDHPWNFLNIVLKGGYEEHYVKFKSPNKYDGSRYGYRENTVGKIRFNKSTNVHMIKSLIKSPTVTLVITGRRFRDWGYYIPDGSWRGKVATWINNVEYRKLKNKEKRNG